MIVRTIEMLLEYISIILCIHKAAKEKIEVNCWLVSIFLLEWGLLYTENALIFQTGKIIIYICLLMYTNKIVGGNWRETIKIYGTMFFAIVLLQLLGMFIISHFFDNKEYYGTIINGFICICIFLWKKEYGQLFINIVSKAKGIYIVLLLYFINLVRMFYLCYIDGYIEFRESIRFLVQTMILSLLLFIWGYQEKENQKKAKELQMYELYNKAFEEVIRTIRSNQHEFRNQINAIKCMKYAVNDKNELLLEQEKYCDYLLKNSEMSDLLKLNAEPALIGFLYAKFSTAVEKHIVIAHTVNAINIREKIPCYDMIEIVGILFDNAVEAIENSNCNNRKIIFKLIEIEKEIILEVSNVSRIYTNNEIEKFLTYGFSTKGKNRGIGLERVKMIIKHINATLLIQNNIYDEENYLSFIINFTDR